MRCSSHPKTGGRRWRGLRLGLLASCSALAAGAAYAQPGQVPQTQTTTVPQQPVSAPTQAPQRLNPTGRPIVLTVPAKDGNFYLGDIGLTIGADDSLAFSSQRVLDLLSNILDPKILDTLRGSMAGKATVSPADFAGTGIQVSYDPQTLELNLFIPAHMRAARSVQVSALNQARFGAYQKSASFSAYMNILGSETYVEKGAKTGWANPTFNLTGAARIGPFALESAQVWQPGASAGSSSFQRLGSRVIYDDTTNLIRWSFGDLQPVGRAFESSPQMAGISAFRSYSLLEPQLIARPTGQSSFTLARPSDVEVYVNGQLVRRVQLAPGTYNLSDFPFTQGANDVRLNITDDSGATQVLRFNLFLDQSQLGRGLSEFGFYAGVKAPLQTYGPHYTNDWVVSGWYRRGITDMLTLGVNFQADKRVSMGGVEAVAGTSIGVFSGNVDVSNVSGFGSGYAATITYQRIFQRASGQSDSLNLAFQTTSKNFGPVDTIIPNNPYEWVATAGLSHSFSTSVYGGLQANYSKGRNGVHDDETYRATLGWRMTQFVSATADVLYENTATRRDVAAILSLTWRIGQYSSVRGDYDSRDNNARLTYQTLHGYGVGSYNLSADIERTDSGSGLNGAANYIANRAELGISQFSTFNGDFSSATNTSTSFRFGTSVGFADGAASIGRPIYDSFAVVVPYRTLAGAPVIVNPTPYGFDATTGVLGSAIEPNLASYNERVITVDAPTAPIGVDMGSGAFRVYPPYHGGYRLQVGSEYYVTAVGRLVTAEGAPVSLVSGNATELAHPDHEAVVVFTNREGRFGLTGLRPGKWRIDMLTDPPTSFVVDIPANAQGVVRLGDVTSTNGQ